jgi:tRNA G26 N,N-dimethylase Trm1
MIIMQNIKEGKAKISIDGNVFFNPKMQELRDISVMFLKTYGHKVYT